MEAKKRYYKRPEPGPPKWLLAQDLREKELSRKHPELFREVADKFYGCLNEYPKYTKAGNYPREILEHCFKTHFPKHWKNSIVPSKIKDSFQEVFVEKFEQGGFENKNASPDAPTGKRY